jgi:hypothetical protein
VEHGHNPKHGFIPAVADADLDIVAEALLAPGRNTGHNAICDGCDKVILRLSKPLTLRRLTDNSTFTVSVTSVSTVQTGITAPPALSMPASSTLAIGLYLSMNP